MRSARESIRKLPVVGYVLRFCIDLVTLPIALTDLRRDLREFFRLLEDQRHLLAFHEQRHQDLLARIRGSDGRCERTEEQIRVITAHFQELSGTLLQFARSLEILRQQAEGSSRLQQISRRSEHMLRGGSGIDSSRQSLTSQPEPTLEPLHGSRSHSINTVDA